MAAENSLTLPHMSVQSCLDAIKQRDGYLKAVSALHPQISKDAEQDGLRGVPILLKDNIDVLGMPTTAGALALRDYYPKANAVVVDRLLAAGLVVLGKTTMSEMAWCKSDGLSCGWSALHGQAQSAFVRGGVQPDGPIGHSSPNGSSSGPCIAVSAGYAPLAIGTETFGSLTNPANRAGVYTIKPTPGLVPSRGILPVSPVYDTAGPIARTPREVTLLLSVMTGRKYSGNAAWPRIGTLDPVKWWTNPNMCFPSSADPEMLQGTLEAYDMLRTRTAVSPVELPDLDMHVAGAGHAIIAHVTHVMEDAFNAYADRTLASIVEYNRANPQPGGQSLLEAATSPHSDDVKSRVCARLDEQGAIFLKAFDDNNVDVIVAAGDSTLFVMATAGKCPSAVLPVGCLDFNGRPYGLTLTARPGHDEVLLGLMQAWYEEFGTVLSPLY